MAKHDVTFEVPTCPLGRSDVTFVVKGDRSVVGTLTVSNGSIVWFPRGTTKGYKMTWAKFDSVMQEQTTRGERR